MREKPAEKDNSERYLLTYADLMNLLLILFIVLYCMATKDVKRTAAVMTAIAKGFGTTTSSGMTGNKGSNSSKALSAAATSDYSDFYAQLIGLLKKRGLLNKVDIADQNNEVVITLKDTVLFKPGKADLDSNATSLLHTIGTLMTKITFGSVFVEGNTDSDPLNVNSQFKNNWYLSSTRALNVSEILLGAGLDPTKVFPVGFGEYHPIAKNDTVENKAKNRRVVIAIVRKGLTPADKVTSASELQKLMLQADSGSVSTDSSTSTAKKTTKATSNASANASANKTVTTKTKK